ncbi:MAG: NAD(P)H-binding protein, partial [Pseudomonadota bacterium]
MTTILVLGGYGLIGRTIVAECVKAGHGVVGFGRSIAKGQASNPAIAWRVGDLRTLTRPQDFASILEGIDVVINASGALQTGGQDNVARTQQTAIIALIDACEAHGIQRFIQISAPNVSVGDPIEFYATKAAADAHLAASSLSHTILRPGLVLSPMAYGGTALLRMLAAVPIVQPIACANAPVQTVGVDVVAKAAARAVTDEHLTNMAFDLVEAKPQPLRTVVLDVRGWLGFAKPRFTFDVGRPVARVVARGADLAGRLGWRSPLRTTAMRVLEEGVVGDPKPWRKATGETPAPLGATLAALPSTPQERLYARSALLFPVLLYLLAVFWFVS